MKEESEIAKTSYQAVSDIKDIWENPLAQFIVSHISAILPAVSSGIEKALEMRQKKKLEELFEIALEDDTITLEDLQDVDCILEFARTIDVVNRLIRNDKVKYLARLLKNSIQDRERDVDEFEELLDKIATLSLREMELLYLLYEEEERACQEEATEAKGYNQEEGWKSFVEGAQSKYELVENEVISKMLGVMRTGFCVGEWRTYLNGRAELVMRTSPDYRRLLERVK